MVAIDNMDNLYCQYECKMLFRIFIVLYIYSK